MRKHHHGKDIPEKQPHLVHQISTIFLFLWMRQRQVEYRDMQDIFLNIAAGYNKKDLMFIMK